MIKATLVDAARNQKFEFEVRCNEHPLVFELWIHSNRIVRGVNNIDFVNRIYP